MSDEDDVCEQCQISPCACEPAGAAPLVEGRDYVMENGLLVFTREYHLRRGSCCGSGCRNCPY